VRRASTNKISYEEGKREQSCDSSAASRVELGLIMIAVHELSCHWGCLPFVLFSISSPV